MIFATSVFKIWSVCRRTKFFIDLAFKPCSPSTPYWCFKLQYALFSDPPRVWCPPTTRIRVQPGSVELLLRLSVHQTCEKPESYHPAWWREPMWQRKVRAAEWKDRKNPGRCVQRAKPVATSYTWPRQTVSIFQTHPNLLPIDGNKSPKILWQGKQEEARWMSVIQEQPESLITENIIIIVSHRR